MALSMELLCTLTNIISRKHISDISYKINDVIENGGAMYWFHVNSKITF